MLYFTLTDPWELTYLDSFLILRTFQYSFHINSRQMHIFLWDFTIFYNFFNLGGKGFHDISLISEPFSNKALNIYNTFYVIWIQYRNSPIFEIKKIVTTN